MWIQAGLISSTNGTNFPLLHGPEIVTISVVIPRLTHSSSESVNWLSYHDSINPGMVRNRVPGNLQ